MFRNCTLAKILASFMLISLVVLILPTFVSPEETNTNAPASPDEPEYTCGDMNGDFMMNMFDALAIDGYVFGGSAPEPEAGNVDGCGLVTIADAYYLLRYLYYGPPGPQDCSETDDWCSTVDLSNVVSLGAPEYDAYPDTDSIAVPILLDNTFAVGAFTFGFCHVSDDIEITSVTTAGGLLNGQTPRVLALPGENKFLVGSMNHQIPLVQPQTGGTLLKLNVQILAGDPQQAIDLDSCFVPPGGEFILVNTSRDVIRPAFNPGVADSDSDGIPNDEDNCPLDPNPGQENGDGDSHGDVCDNCPLVDNENQNDMDGDDIGNACDDSDGDGYVDASDNCPFWPNPGQENNDGDGMGDVCDWDDDNDGVNDNIDNCQFVSNSGQGDGDGDGKGDACDVADVAFISDVNCGSAPLTVDFTDQTIPSGTITDWLWEFGDGETSDLQHPSHQYDDVGDFDVTLTVWVGAEWDELTRESFVVTQTGPIADFIAVPAPGKAPLIVMFEPLVTGAVTDYHWLFGDGNESFDPNPIHTYTTGGTYDVTFTASLNLGPCSQEDTEIKTDYITVRELDADFSADPLARAAPLGVQFTDQTTGSPNSWDWNFGDGEFSSDQNPWHEYQDPGWYDVSLQVSNSAGDDDEKLKLDYIHVGVHEFVDLHAEIFSWASTVRPGFELSIFYKWYNIGTVDAENCVLVIVLPEGMEFWELYDQSGLPATGYTIDGGVITYDLGTVSPSDWSGGERVWVHGRLSEFVPIGTIIYTEMWLSTTSPETETANNYDYYEIEVRGSMDPNDKLAHPGGKELAFDIAPDQRIQYTVRFENKAEATAAATYITVLDTLDDNLDWGTLAFGDMSHPDDCEASFDPVTGVITWFCEDIELVPNVIPPEGEGWFTFSVSPLPGLPDDTDIPNEVWIRFDYNAWLAGPELGPVVRTINGCDCETWGSVNGDDKINPTDVVLMVNFVYKGDDTRVPHANCPYQSGDVNCSGGNCNPTDVVHFVNYVYKDIKPWPCIDPCQ